MPSVGGREERKQTKDRKDSSSEPKGAMPLSSPSLSRRFSRSSAPSLDVLRTSMEAHERLERACSRRRPKEGAEEHGERTRGREVKRRSVTRRAHREQKEKSNSKRGRCSRLAQDLPRLVRRDRAPGGFGHGPDASRKRPRARTRGGTGPTAREKEERRASFCFFSMRCAVSDEKAKKRELSPGPTTALSASAPEWSPRSDAREVTEDAREEREGREAAEECGKGDRKS